ncbi:MAG TPA: hypothetical protein VF152_10990 [Acidimicrobiia bacterium]
MATEEEPGSSGDRRVTPIEEQRSETVCERETGEQPDVEVIGDAAPAAVEAVGGPEEDAMRMETDDDQYEEER